jgi:hypothetical protein
MTNPKDLKFRENGHVSANIIILTEKQYALSGVVSEHSSAYEYVDIITPTYTPVIRMCS